MSDMWKDRTLIESLVRQAKDFCCPVCFVKESLETTETLGVPLEQVCAVLLMVGVELGFEFSASNHAILHSMN